MMHESISIRGWWPALAVALALAAQPVRAQGVRGWVGTTVQAVELRPLVLDSVSPLEATVGEDGGFYFEDDRLTCPLPDLCTRYLPGAEAHSIAATNDVSLTAWGFGVEGLSFTTLLRSRARMGSTLVWPRSDDQFDAILGYAQLVRGKVRARVGRQEVRSGLGFSGFDGGTFTVSLPHLDMETYGGRSLARGLRESASEALQGLESFVPDQTVFLLGASARGRGPAGSYTARYQREILSEGADVVSERASFDFETRAVGTRLSGSMDYDFAGAQWGKGHLTLSRALSEGRWLVELTGRRYVPYFQLSTIWGFFEPVSYSEALVRVAWSPTASLGLWTSGGRRQYGDTRTNVVIAPMTDDGWRADLGGRWVMSEQWSFDGRYRVDWGPGSFLSSGDVSARYAYSDKISVSASGTTFQQIDEFRVGEGRAVGGGLSADVRLTSRMTLAGGGTVVRHRNGDLTSRSPWNQTRGWTSLRIGVGGDPGLATRRTPR